MFHFLVVFSLFVFQPVVGYSLLLLRSGPSERPEQESVVRAAPHTAVCKVQIPSSQSHGTGTLIAVKGNTAFILTARHVIQDNYSAPEERPVAIFSKQNKNFMLTVLSAFSPMFQPLE